MSDIKLTMEEMQKEIIALKRQVAKLQPPTIDKITELKDGDWIHIHRVCDTFSYIAKYRPGYNNYFISAYIAVCFYTHNGDIFAHHKDADKLCIFEDSEVRLATATEIKGALLNYASHLGFKKDIICNLLTFQGTDVQDKNYKIKNIGFDPITYDLYQADDGIIFYNEECFWAQIQLGYEIVPGYFVNFFNDVKCEINGETFTKPYINNLIAALNIDAIHSINVGCSGQFKLTVNDLGNLMEYWNQQF
jgi:hypothetical protein